MAISIPSIWVSERVNALLLFNWLVFENVISSNNVCHLFYWFAKNIERKWRIRVKWMLMPLSKRVKDVWLNAEQFQGFRKESYTVRTIVWCVDHYTSHFLFICVYFSSSFSSLGECSLLLSIGSYFIVTYYIDTIHWDSIQIKYQYKRFYRYLFCDVISLHCSRIVHCVLYWLRDFGLLFLLLENKKIKIYFMILFLWLF